jgi:hypothetical protein
MIDVQEEAMPPLSPPGFLELIESALSWNHERFWKRVWLLWAAKRQLLRAEIPNHAVLTCTVELIYRSLRWCRL